MNNWIQSFFNFSKTEANGFIVLLTIMIVAVFGEITYEKLYTPDDSNIISNEETRIHRHIDSLTTAWKTKKYIKKKRIKKPSKAKLFPFNPNKADETTLVSLGLPSYLARRIVKYRTKGGHFNIRSDLLKIYGMDSLWYSRITTFITLPSEQKQKQSIYSKTSKKASKTEPFFDLNLADSTTLMSIIGINPKLSKRIIKYRSLLGGFVKEKQLFEVYGMDSNVVKKLIKQSFIASTYEPDKININRDIKKMMKHPYVGYKLAKAMQAYQFQHGDFKSIDSLTKIRSWDTIIITKIKPYLTLQSKH